MREPAKIVVMDTMAMAWPKFELVEEPGVRFLALMPVYESEVEFVRDRGPDAFDDLLDESDVDYGDPNRSPVV